MTYATIGRVFGPHRYTCGCGWGDLCDAPGHLGARCYCNSDAWPAGRPPTSSDTGYIHGPRLPRAPHARVPASYRGAWLDRDGFRRPGWAGGTFL